MTTSTTTLPPPPPPRPSSSSNSSNINRSSQSFRRKHFNNFAPRAPALVLLLLLAVVFVADVVAAESGYIGEYDRDTARRSRRTNRRENIRPARSKYSRYTGGIGQRYGRGLLRRLLEVEDVDSNVTAGATTASTENLRTSDAGVSGAFEEEQKPDPSTCLTLLQIIETHPNLTRLAEAMSDLPVVGPWRVS